MGLIVSTAKITPVSDLSDPSLQQLLQEEVEGGATDKCTAETVVNWAPYKVWQLFVASDKDPISKIARYFGEENNEVYYDI